MLRLWRKDGIGVGTNMTTEWTPRKKNLLMYFETCLVDGYGMFDHRKINDEEVEWAEEWEAEGLIDFSYPGGWVRFYSEEAWTLAHRFRRERSERMMKKYEV